MRGHKEILEEVARYYDMPLGSSDGINAPFENVDYFLKHFPDSSRKGRMLDLGCGHDDSQLRTNHPTFVGVHQRFYEAWLSRAAVWAGMRVDGLDLPPSSPRVHVPESSEGSWNYHSHDIRKSNPLPFDSDIFDVVLANRVVHSTHPSQASFGLSPHLFQQFSLSSMGFPLQNIANAESSPHNPSFEDYAHLREFILSELMRVLRPQGLFVLNQIFFYKPSHWRHGQALLPANEITSGFLRSDSRLAFFPFESQQFLTTLAAFRQRLTHFQH